MVAAERRRGADAPRLPTSRSGTSSTSSRRSAAAARCTSGSSTSCRAGGLACRRCACRRSSSPASRCRPSRWSRGELIGDKGAAGVVLLTAVAPIPVLYATFGRPHTLLFAWLQWGTRARAARRPRRRPALVDRRRARARALGLRPSDRAALRADGVRRRSRLRAAAAAGGAARGMAGRGRAARRRSSPTTCARCTCSATATASARRSRTAGRSRAARSGRTRCTSSRPAATTSTTSRSSRSSVRSRSSLRARGASARVLRDHGRVARPLLHVRPGERRLGALLRPLHDPGDARVHDARRRRLSGGRRLGAAARVPSRSCCSSAGCSTIELRYDHNRLDRQHGIGLDAVTQAVRHEPAGTVLFGSTGTSGASFSSFDYGHPANLLDRYLSLRVPSLEYVDDDSCVRALAFVRGSSPRRGLWVFYAAAPDERAAARRAFAAQQRRYDRHRRRGVLRRPLASHAPAASARGTGPEASTRLARGGPAERAGERAVAGGPAATAHTARLQALRRARRPGHLAALAAGHDDPPVDPRSSARQDVEGDRDVLAGCGGQGAEVEDLVVAEDRGPRDRGAGARRRPRRRCRRARRRRPARSPALRP